jgi:1-deoxy-D-xylulose-5-phosphate synthase
VSIADALRDLVPVQGPCVRVLGVPVAYIPHGKPDVILASLGLDADGIVAEYQAFAANSTPAR